jgi:hypothetical protein
MNPRNRYLVRGFYKWHSCGLENTESSGIAAWEYRGPLTTPNNEEGSRGSCIAEGTTGAVLLSETWSNGFVIFDSNWWDNPDNPCTDENFGTGPAPDRISPR